MNLVYSDKQKRVIQGQEQIKFSSFSSFHLVILTARAKGEKQFTPPSTDDEDLTVEVDGKKFPKLGTKNALIDSPASFNGGKLHNLSQTIYFLVFLNGKDHKVILGGDKPHATATFESLEVYSLEITEQLVLNIGKTAEDGDRRPWLTFVFADLSVERISANLTLKRRFIDSDDVKVIIDGDIKRNDRSLLHKFWYLAASLLFGENQSVNFPVNLLPGPHYIEFWADRMPILRDFIVNFVKVPATPSEIPTVERPKWTGNFYDDTEAMLLARATYGESGSESDAAKLAVGWAIRNRVEDPKGRWGNNYHEVILAPFQFAPFTDHSTKAFQRITNPLLDNPIEKSAWEKSFSIADDVISNRVPDPTKGANHFYSTIQSPPAWADEEEFTIQFGPTKFYKL